MLRLETSTASPCGSTSPRAVRSASHRSPPRSWSRARNDPAVRGARHRCRERAARFVFAKGHRAARAALGLGGASEMPTASRSTPRSRASTRFLDIYPVLFEAFQLKYVNKGLCSTRKKKTAPRPSPSGTRRRRRVLRGLPRRRARTCPGRAEPAADRRGLAGVGPRAAQFRAGARSRAVPGGPRRLGSLRGALAARRIALGV